MDRSFAKNAASLLLVQASNFLLPLLTFPYLTRILGPESFGQLAFSTAVMTYFVLLTDYGFNLSATKQIAEYRSDKKRVSEIAFNTLIAKLILAILSAIIIFCLISTIPKFREIKWILIAALPSILGTVLFPQWLYQGLERMGFVSLCIISSRVALLPLTFVFVHAPADVWKSALITSCSSLVAGCLSIIIIINRKLIDWHKPKWKDISATYRDGWHIFLSTAAVSLYSNTNNVILGFISGNAAVGYFSSAERIRSACSSLASVIGTAIYPRINSIISHDRSKAFVLLHKLLIFQGTVTLLISACLFLLAPLLIRTALGPKYEAAVDVLRLISAVPFAVGLSNALGVQTMLALGMKQIFTKIVIISGILSVIIAIPFAYWMDEKGAGITLLVTEFFVAAFMFFTLKQKKILPFSKAI